MSSLGRAAPFAFVGLLLHAGCLAPAKTHGAGNNGDGGAVVGDGGISANVTQPTGAAALVSESFPPGLALPYPGPASTVYDNTFIRYPQLKAKVLAIFNDNWVRNGVDEFAARIALFGGVDFVSNVNEARVATPDFLLALDDMAKDVCAQASTNKAGPFATIDPTTITGSDMSTRIGNLYQAILYRPVTSAEITAATQLLTDLTTNDGSTPQDAWAGLCEGLVHHQDFLFLREPSMSTVTGADKQKLLLVRVAQDLLGHPPTSDDFNALSSGQKDVPALVDDYLASTDFRDWFFYRMQIKTGSSGTDSANEPARLWTYIATNNKPFTDLFVADYTVDTSWAQQSRDADYGTTGILTMAGFIAGKPGLPHFTYAARVFGDYFGITFEVPPSIVAMRVGATAATTVTPGSLCFTCHQMLTPLAYQRQRWFDDGTYHTTDANGDPINDSDQDIVPSYPFRGEGMQAFATQAIKKEAFILKMFNAMYLLTLNREMRAYDDERTVYKQLWDLNVSSNGNLRQILKTIITNSVYSNPSVN